MSVVLPVSDVINMRKIKFFVKYGLSNSNNILYQVYK